MRGWIGAILLVACGPDPTEGIGVRMDFASEDFWGSPFPGDHRRVAGAVSLAGYPNPDAIAFVDATLGLLDGYAEGFGTTSGVFFGLDGPVEVPEIGWYAAIGADAEAYLVVVDPDAPDVGTRHPVRVRLELDGGPLGTPFLLSMLPLQGRPLRANTRYAAVIRRGVSTPPLAVDPAVRDLAKGRVPEGLGVDEAAAWLDAVETLDDLGEDLDEVAALTVFTTWDPVRGVRTLLEAARAQPTPTLASAPILSEVFDGFCVYHSTTSMPVFQRGEPPFLGGGGGIGLEAGAPELQGWEEANVWLTVPRAPAPPEGWPTAVFIRTGGGGDRPLIDRGVRDAEGNVTVPGSGPARVLAEAGVAGVSVDGPHGGLRNITGGDEQFLIFNVANPAAMRDNLRQSAVELALLPDVLAGLVVDASDCPGADGDAPLASDRLALIGHSMGATIAPLTLGLEPRYDAAVLSGAGGSWIENLVFKQSPLEVRPLAEAVLHYPQRGRTLHEHDPFLSIVQWGGEVADPPAFATALRSSARDLLMVQGIVDTYILPPMANATSLSLGLDLGGDALDVDHPELADFEDLGSLLPLSSGGAVPLATSGGWDRGRTGVVVQHAEDGVEDGHEVFFQLEGPKHQLRCFLQGWVAGEVPVVAKSEGPCP